MRTRRTRLGMKLKHAVDRAGAAAMLGAVGPLFAGIALAIKFDDGVVDVFRVKVDDDDEFVERVTHVQRLHDAVDHRLTMHLDERLYRVVARSAKALAFATRRYDDLHRGSQLDARQTFDSARNAYRCDNCARRTG